MAELIPGIEHDFGRGRIYVIPPLSLGALERLQDKLAALMSGGNAIQPTTIATVVDATHAALRRNYPDLKREDVAELVDVGNMHEVIGKVMDVAGLRRKELEGNAKAAAQAPAAPPPSPT